MPDDESSDGREWSRVALVVACVLAAAVAAILLPIVTSGGLAGSPADSALPGDQLSGTESSESANNPEDLGGVGELGALDPGDETGVGGRVGADDTYNNTDTEVHFEVESPEPAYWRTGTYDRYTGAGWEQSGTDEAYDGPLDHDGLAGERFTYEVQLNRSATRLPTAWRPESVGEMDADLAVTPGNAIATRGVVESGTSFTATSVRPERDVSVLRAADGDMPTEIEQQYTELPDDTPDRVGDLTEDIIDDTDTQYDAAMAVQNWLRTEKEYSLEVSASGDQIADHFIFEMDAGYCEYFATAMVAMLRSQGIPARYAVGYSTGEQVEDGHYEVRGMNAHAWVEVYFPDVGWVQFEPTPGDERLANQADALDGDPDLEEEGSPGETFEADPDDDDDEDAPTDSPDDDVTIELNRTAVPGATVEVSVTENGEPVRNTEVLFNGEVVGMTDGDGTVVATVPFTEELEITLGGSPFVSSVATGGASGGGVSGTVDGPGTGAFNLSRSVEIEDEPEKTVDVETGATVTVSGETMVDGTVTVTATVDGVPIPDASVAIDGEQVARTDENGQATVTLPDRPGSVDIVVERAPVAGETTVEVPDIELTVDSDWPVALPGTTATAEVTTDDNESVAGADVLLGGERVAETGADGTATVTLPLSSEATVTAVTHGLERQETVGGLLRNAAIALFLVVGLLGGGIAGVARSKYGLRDGLGLLRQLPQQFTTYATWALVVAATRSRAFLRQAGVRALRTIGAAVALVRRKRTPRDVWLAFRAWLAQNRTRYSRNGEDSDSDTAVRGEGRSDAYVSVRAAWQRFLGVISITRAERHTPGELARHAVEEDDLPSEAVDTLRDAFREIEYGDRRASSRLERVQQAIDEIEGADSEERGER